MSPRKTFTPKTHYSTVKHNEITLSATFNKKKSASSNSITATKNNRKFLQDRIPKSQNRATHKFIDTNKQANNKFISSTANSKTHIISINDSFT